MPRISPEEAKALVGTLADLPPGAPLRIRVADGAATARVDEPTTMPEHGGNA